MESLIRFIKNWRPNHPTTGWFIRAFAIVLGLYVVSYLPLTLQGVYSWGAMGLDGPKDWMWYPKGFGYQNKQRGFLRRFYLPLFFLDTRYWHTEFGVYRDPPPPRFDGFPP